MCEKQKLEICFYWDFIVNIELNYQNNGNYLEEMWTNYQTIKQIFESQEIK